MHCAIDVETSGLSPFRGDRVIELAAVMIGDGEIVEEFSTLINAPCTIHLSAKRLHGISRAMLKNQPGPAEAWKRFQLFVGDAPLIAHNAQFDMEFIRYELSGLKKHLSNRSICTLRLARRRYPRLPRHRLEDVARHVLGEIPKDCRLHRALGDARLVARLWMALNVYSYG